MPSDRSTHGGRAELGQNDLHDHATIDAIVALVRRTRGPILEIGAGTGALTRPLAALGRPLVAVELDEHRVAGLRRGLPDVEVVHADATRYRWGPHPRGGRERPVPPHHPAAAPRARRAGLDRRR